MRLPFWFAGRAAERRAARLLRAAGLEILARNVRTRSGEIDLVAREGPVLVIVEVRRRAPHLLAARQSFDRAKRECLLRSAREARHKLRLAAGIPLRFDLVLFDGDGNSVHVRDVIRDAPAFLI